MVLASLLRRLGALCYESLLLLALWMLGTALFIYFLGNAQTEAKHFGLQFFLWAIAGLYFVWYWRKSGQTLAMQTWRIQVVSGSGGCLSLEQALLRYGLASVSTLCLGLGFLWALLDKDKQFLHDRLLGSRIIVAQPPTSK